VRLRGHGAMRPSRLVISRPMRTRKSERFSRMRRYFGSAAFLRMMSELNQKPSQPGILFKQRVHVVAVFVTPK
jgi:hypothetical protein